MRAILLRVEWLLISGLWSMCAYAYAQARPAFGQELLQVDLLIWLCVLVLAAIGGITSLVLKLQDPSHPIRSVPLMVAGHLLGSITAGLLAFFQSANGELSDMQVAAAITLAGFAGTWALEKARVKLLGGDAPPPEPDRRSGIDRREE